MSSRFARSMAVMSACALLWAACSKSGNKADTTAAVDTAKAANTAAAAPMQPTLNDTTILAMLGEINSADSSAGNLASTKGTAASVKSFGRQMMTDHHKLNVAGEALAKKLNIKPNPPAVDTIPAAVQRTTDSLTAMPKGAAWDQAYIGHEIALHQAVLNFLQTAQGAASDSSLKTALSQSAPLIQAHLTRAQQVQSKLPGGGATAAAGAAASPTPSADTTVKTETGKKAKKG